MFVVIVSCVKFVFVCITDTFHSSATGKNYTMHFRFNCCSSNVAYLLLTYNDRMRESLWLYRFDGFIPEGLIIRQVGSVV